ALMERNFAAFSEVVEYDSNLMHAVMMTSRPPLFYWLPPTLAIMEQIRQWRDSGLHVCYTLDAGPNVHCICAAQDADEVKAGLAKLTGVEQVRSATVGGAAYLVDITEG
ncbi:MAG: diphosphomevalonate decarboxylase, partial [Chitinophagaceae bacterium]|nr:diphosphomevalonate decarboxylase [Anaerolineae bacterium]